MFGVGADEDDAGLSTAARETAALGQEPVARVDRLATAGLGGLNNRFLVEVCRRARAAERVRLVGNAGVQARCVVLGVDGNRTQPEVGRGTGDADGDLAAVGDQQSVETHGVSGWWFGWTGRLHGRLALRAATARGPRTSGHAPGLGHRSPLATRL